MKKLSFLILIFALGAGRAPAATAYEALQTIKQARGDAILKQLIEVRGETGQPQPQSWTILMNDPAARGGIREFVVGGGEITSERTPLHGYTGDGKLPALNFTRLNLDSDGAFKLANQQATAKKLGFHTVDYTLRTNDTDGAPMWVLRLFDYMGAPVGTLQVSAESGKIVRGLQVDPDAREKPVVQQSAPPPTPAPAASAPPDEESPNHFKGGVFGFFERTGKTIGTTTKDVSIKVGNTVKDTSLNVAGTVQEALTGERTIGAEATPSPTPGR